MPSRRPVDPELAEVIAATRRAHAAGGDDWAGVCLALDLALIGLGERARVFKGDELQAERIFRLLDERLGRAAGQRARRRWRRREIKSLDGGRAWWTSRSATTGLS